jgi:hypothetical protein
MSCFLHRKQKKSERGGRAGRRPRMMAVWAGSSQAGKSHGLLSQWTLRRLQIIRIAPLPGTQGPPPAVARSRISNRQLHTRAPGQRATADSEFKSCGLRKPLRLRRVLRPWQGMGRGSPSGTADPPGML